MALTADEKRKIDAGLLYRIEEGNPNIFSGTAAPNFTPSKIGDVYIDTSAKKAYTAMGTTNSSDWVILN
jgi:hypothetical protein